MKYLNTKPGSIEEIAAKMSKYATESGYQDMFKKELEKAGKGIGSMTPAEKKAFFNKIDSKYTAKDEAVKEPYAVGMAAAMKQTGDKPPLKKSTITKAHDIAKSIEKDQKNEEKDVPKGYHKMPDGSIMKDSEHKKEDYSKKDVDKFHTSLDKLVHKSFGHSSDEKKKEMKKETHSFVTNKMNQKQKDVDGEKELVKNEADEKGDEINKMKLAKVKQGEKDIIDPKPKMSFKEAYKKVKEAMNTVGDATADRANQMVGQDDKKNDPDVKKPKAKTDAGTPATPVDTSPEVEYKN